MKNCAYCKRDLPLSEFYIKRDKGKSPRYSHDCKECHRSKEKKRIEDSPELKELRRVRSRIWYGVNKEQALARMKAEREAKTPLERRLEKYLSTYGLTPEKFYEMLTRQEYKCRICKNPLGELDCCVDHDHKTQWIRGLLCPTCNTGLGAFRDSHTLLYAASDYLKETTDEYVRSQSPAALENSTSP